MHYAMEEHRGTREQVPRILTWITQIKILVSRSGRLCTSYVYYGMLHVPSDNADNVWKMW